MSLLSNSFPDVKIDHDIPVPGHPRRTTGLPFGKMGVGDSFFVAGDDKVHHRVRANLTNFSRTRKDGKFATRVIEESGTLGIRVWKTA